MTPCSRTATSRSGGCGACSTCPGTTAGSLAFTGQPCGLRVPRCAARRRARLARAGPGQPSPRPGSWPTFAKTCVESWIINITTNPALQLVGLFLVVCFGSCMDVAAIQQDMPLPMDFNRELTTVGAWAVAAVPNTGNTLQGVLDYALPLGGTAVLLRHVTLRAAPPIAHARCYKHGHARTARRRVQLHRGPRGGRLHWVLHLLSDGAAGGGALWLMGEECVCSLPHAHVNVLFPAWAADTPATRARCLATPICRARAQCARAGSAGVHDARWRVQPVEWAGGGADGALRLRRALQRGAGERGASRRACAHAPLVFLAFPAAHTLSRPGRPCTRAQYCPSFFFGALLLWFGVEICRDWCAALCHVACAQ